MIWISIGLQIKIWTGRKVHFVTKLYIMILMSEKYNMEFVVSLDSTEVEH